MQKCVPERRGAVMLNWAKSKASKHLYSPKISIHSIDDNVKHKGRLPENPVGPIIALHYLFIKNKVLSIMKGGVIWDSHEHTLRQNTWERKAKIYSFSGNISCCSCAPASWNCLFCAEPSVGRFFCWSKCWANSQFLSRWITYSAPSTVCARH